MITVQVYVLTAAALSSDIKSQYCPQLCLINKHIFNYNQILAYTEDFQNERADRTKAAAERYQLEEQLEKCKAEWEESKAKMQLVIDDLTKADQLKVGRIHRSGNYI